MISWGRNRFKNKPHTAKRTENTCRSSSSGFDNTDAGPGRFLLLGTFFLAAFSPCCCGCFFSFPIFLQKGATEEREMRNLACNQYGLGTVSLLSQTSRFYHNRGSARQRKSRPLTDMSTMGIYHRKTRGNSRRLSDRRGV